jgi:hypothetical protein
MNDLQIQNKSELAHEIAYTENGAAGFKQTKSGLLDMNFKVASYRQRSDSEIICDWTKAFSEDANYSFKWIHFVRDIQEGLGERRLYRIVMSHICSITRDEDNVKSALLWNVNEGAGRWDDFIAVTHQTSYWDWACETMWDKLQKDAVSDHPSLLAKWLPSENTSSKKTRKLATEIRTKWRKTSREYRKILSELRRRLDVTEVKTSSNRWEDIDYQKVPSVANRKYNAAFYKHDAVRRGEFLEKVEKGEAKINSSANFPHDIVAMYASKINMGSWRRDYNVQEDPAIEALWKALKPMGIENTLVVADGSGSMTSAVSGRVTALDIANALAIYTSEHNSGEFKNKYITFSEHPQFVDFSRANTLLGKLMIAYSHNEVANTNIEAVFDLILNTAIKNKTSQEDLPKNICIISDMEFDSATVGRPNLTLFQNIKRRYRQSGYEMPRLIFWNVNSRTNVIPVNQNEAGVALVSGFSQNILKMVMSGKLDPLAVLLETLDNERYKPIIWD